MTDDEPELLGYLSALAVYPGDRVEAMVSCTLPEFRAELVRLRHGDASSAGPGALADVVRAEGAGRFPGRVQRARPGSYGTAHLALPGGPVSLDLWLMPSIPRKGTRQGVLVLDSGVGLVVDEDGTLLLELPGARAIAAPGPLEAWQWAHVTAVVDPRAGAAMLRVATSGRPGGVRAASGAVAAAPRAASRVLLAATDVTVVDGIAGRVGGFDGRIEAPAIYDVALDPGAPASVAPLAAWAFERRSHAREAPDTGPQRAHMVLAHLPQRLVLGHRDRADATGDVPLDRLNAVHFHADDLEDAGWAPSLTLTVPSDAPSGVYGVRLSAGAVTDTIPVFVLPPADRPRADVAVLFPTFSYLAYANERLQEAPRDMEPGDERGLPIVSDRGDLILRRRRDLGLSTYDVHGDGSGCCYSSARRPILNMRPDHRNWQTHAPRALAADLYLVHWLDHAGVSFDALDDGTLHAAGDAALDGYRVVITGAHPEYWSEQMLDAAERFLAGGGRIMYLGGNGFYWVTSVDPERPHVIEVRRGYNGTRPWEPRPCEARHSTSGEVGGLWRYRGRGPNRLVGIGFSAQGYGPKAAPYRRLPDAAHPRAAWMFDGVPEGPIGDAGLIMDGAAGDEMDRADEWLGTPPHALVVATSAGQHPDTVSVVVEDLLIAHPGVGGTRHPLVRSDVVFFETAAGGAVFSAGSMGWTGCLSQNDYDNALARLTTNVLHRFLAPEPFTPEL